ncbi:MAG TPA: ParB/RepB/Spo0J family partition protein [Candidatus Kryptonia bacterium]
MIRKDSGHVEKSVLDVAKVHAPDSISKIAVGRISANKYQPRKEFHRESLEELKSSIRENGLVQPITVRQVEEGRFELISGERRLRAVIELGFEEIPAYIIKIDSDAKLLELALTENLQREDLNPIEIATGYQRLIDECALTQEKVAERVGKDRATVTNFLRLLKLPPQIQKSLAAGEVSAGHARALLAIEDQKELFRVFNKIAREKLSVRQVEQEVKRILIPKIKASSRPAEMSSVDQMPSRKDIIVSDLIDKLKRHLGTQVKINYSENNQGEVRIEFYSEEDLGRVVELILGDREE